MWPPSPTATQRLLPFPAAGAKSIVPRPLRATADHGDLAGVLDVYIFPASPTVTQSPPAASWATPLRSVVPQHERATVHGALPGGLVYRRPSAPPATHKPPPK